MAKIVIAVSIDEDLRSFLKDQVDNGQFPSLSAAADAAVELLKVVSQYQKDHNLTNMPMRSILHSMLDKTQTQITPEAPEAPMLLDRIDLCRPENWEGYLKTLDRQAHYTLDKQWRYSIQTWNEMTSAGVYGTGPIPTSMILGDDWGEHARNMCKRTQYEIRDEQSKLIDTIDRMFKQISR